MRNIYDLDRRELLQGHYAWIWCLLAFQAGFINTFGFLVCGRFVSHVTGAGTQIGMSFAQGDTLGAFITGATPFIFVLGSFVSGALTVARMERGLNPRFSLVTAAVPISLFLFAISGEEVVPKIGSPSEVNIHLLHLYSLTFLCGLQNGCFATMTKEQIRTTHLTGIATDFGSDLARTLLGRTPGRDFGELTRLNWVRFFTFLAFSLGAIFSTLISLKLGNLALYFPTITATLVFLAIFVHGRRSRADAIQF